MDNTYAEEMERDIRDYIENEIQRETWIGHKGKLEEYLNDELFCSDVTGNDLGEYYHNSEQAKETVLKNMDLLGEALFNFGVDGETVARKFIKEDWDYFDVTIRCSILSEYIRLVLDDLDNDGYFDNDEDDDEEGL